MTREIKALAAGDKPPAIMATAFGRASTALPPDLPWQMRAGHDYLAASAPQTRAVPKLTPAHRCHFVDKLTMHDNK